MWTIKNGITLLAAALLILSVSAMAAEQSKVEYSATSISETADGKIEGMVYQAGGKERRETNIDGEKATIIVRPDKKLVWMLIPEERSYMKMKLGESPDKADLSGYKITQTRVGTETIDGFKTTKSKIIATNSKGAKFGGFMWTTREGIVIKTDMISVEKGSKQRIKTQLSNVKIGRQDPGLFEIPEGYSEMSIGKMVMGGMLGGHEETGGDAKDKPADKNGKSSGFGLKDMINLLK